MTTYQGPASSNPAFDHLQGTAGGPWWALTPEPGERSFISPYIGSTHLGRKKSRCDGEEKSEKCRLLDAAPYLLVLHVGNEGMIRNSY